MTSRGPPGPNKLLNKKGCQKFPPREFGGDEDLLTGQRFLPGYPQAEEAGSEPPPFTLLFPTLACWRCASGCGLLSPKEISPSTLTPRRIACADLQRVYQCLDTGAVLSGTAAPSRKTRVRRKETQVWPFCPGRQEEDLISHLSKQGNETFSHLSKQGKETFSHEETKRSWKERNQPGRWIPKDCPLKLTKWPLFDERNEQSIDVVKKDSSETFPACFYQSFV